MSIEKKPSEVVETNETLDQILDVPGVAGASTVVTGSDDNKKRSFMGKPEEEDLAFIEKEEDDEDGTKPPAGTEDDDDPSKKSEKDDDDDDDDPAKPASKDELDNLHKIEEDDDDDDDPTNPKSKAGRKPGLHEVLKSLVDDETIELFEGEDDISKYGNKDAVELIKANIAAQVQKKAQEAPLEVFKNLDPKLQDVVAYNLKGGKDIVQVLKTITASQEISELDIKNPADQERMVREYYRSLNWTEENINTKVASLIDKEELETEAGIVKPELDKQQAAIVQKKIEEQDRKQQEAAKFQQQFADTIFAVLDNPHLNGVPLNRRDQENLYQGMITRDFQDRHGNQTNGLGHIIEELQFGENADHALLLEAFWLMTNPKAYKASLASTLGKEHDAETFRQLKTTSAKKTASSQSLGSGEEKPPKRSGVSRKKQNRSFLERPKS